MYHVSGDEKLLELADFPRPGYTGGHDPSVFSDDHSLLLAYKDENHSTVVLTIKHPTCYMFGHPNEEVLHGHPLFEKGVVRFGVSQVLNSSWIKDLERVNSVHEKHRSGWQASLNHYIFSFHDSTFECVAAEIDIVSPSRTVNGTRDAINAVFEQWEKEQPEQSDINFWNNLGDENGINQCKVKGCVRKNISLSIHCRRHHYEAISGKECPFDKYPV